MGNICRSPLAEGVVRSFARRAGLASTLEVDSAGTHGYHVGEPPDPRARKVAANRGYDVSNLRARCVTDGDFVRFDMILAMDRRNLAFLRRSCPDGYESKLGLFLDYADGPSPDEVPDPYYGGADGFERVLDLCEAAARGLIKAIAKPVENSETDRS